MCSNLSMALRSLCCDCTVLFIVVTILIGCTAEQPNATFVANDRDAGSDNDNDNVENQCDERDAAAAEAALELDKLRQCQDDSGCTGTVPRSHCVGRNELSINGVADTTRYFEALEKAKAFPCNRDDTDVLLIEEVCPHSRTAPARCHEERCEFFSTPCSELGHGYVSEETYSCDEVQPECSWRLDFDPDQGTATYDHVDATSPPAAQSNRYRCPADGSLEVLVSGEWRRDVGKVLSPTDGQGVGPRDVEWRGLRYFVPPPR